MVNLEQAQREHEIQQQIERMRAEKHATARQAIEERMEDIELRNDLAYLENLEC